MLATEFLVNAIGESDGVRIAGRRRRSPLRRRARQAVAELTGSAGERGPSRHGRSPRAAWISSLRVSLAAQLPRQPGQMPGCRRIDRFPSQCIRKLVRFSRRPSNAWSKTPQIRRLYQVQANIVTKSDLPLALWYRQVFVWLPDRECHASRNIWFLLLQRLAELGQPTERTVRCSMSSKFNLM